MADPHPAEQFRSLGKIYQLVSEFLAPIILGLVVDWFAKTAPWGTVVGVLLGMLVGGYRVLKLSRTIGGPPTRPPEGNPPP